MAKLIYAAITSLDGYVNDVSGNFEWAAPDEEVHAYVNDLERSAGTYLYGRRMYEVMKVWEDPSMVEGEPPVVHDYAAIWQAANKIVYSSTLEAVSTAKTTLLRTFDPDAIRTLKESADRDIAVGGPGLAAHAIRANLVDELHWFATPIAVGGGTRWLPDGILMNLALIEERRFANGVVHLHYGVAPG